MVYRSQLVPKDNFRQASACAWSSSSWEVWLCTSLFWRRKSIILRRCYLSNSVNFSFLCEHEVKKWFAKILLIWRNQVKIHWLSKLRQSGGSDVEIRRISQSAEWSGSVTQDLLMPLLILISQRPYFKVWNTGAVYLGGTNLRKSFQGKFFNNPIDWGKALYMGISPPQSWSG